MGSSERKDPKSILEIIQEMFGAEAHVVEIGGGIGKQPAPTGATENFGQHTERNTPFKVGDVIVEASGRSGFIAKSRVFGDIYAGMQPKVPLRLDTEELEDLEYPVTVVAREGDPTVHIVVDRKKSGKFKVRK